MSNASWTHNNPFTQGGWDGEGSWPNDSSSSPAPSSHSSGSTGSSGSAGQWVPAQSSYGILPLAATPGALPPGLLGAPITFRFMASGSQANLSIVGPGGRACYRVRTNTTHSYVSVQAGIIATINWAGAEPAIEMGGRLYRMSDYLRDSRDAHRRRIRTMTIEGREFSWTYDDKGFYIHPSGSFGQILGFVYNLNGIELKVVGNGLSTEMLNNIVIAIILMQGKMFVGLR
ncbi:hypothetical protein M0805_001119 [Coniferiporia weirii]|nr:hypothetical protein M0805_001119 [Coniferiporia weirii]